MTDAQMCKIQPLHCLFRYKKVVKEVTEPVRIIGNAFAASESRKQSDGLLSSFLGENKDLEAMQQEQTAVATGKTITIIAGIVLFIIIILIVWNS